VTPKSAVMDFVGQRSLAVVGVSRTGGTFGSNAYRELKARGYLLVPVHPQAETLTGDRCAKSLASLPAPVGTVRVMVPPQQAEQVVQEAAAAGMRRVWLQLGAESKGMSVDSGKCILMFAEPASFAHHAHRWIKGLFGRLPK
jgi:predicted CoA-binding protein